nr:pyrophosphate--fructose 6-phosphate 1-phosphotransferase subunit alpha [Tanacetum cinerariifolium]
MAVKEVEQLLNFIGTESLAYYYTDICEGRIRHMKNKVIKHDTLELSSNKDGKLFRKRNSNDTITSSHGNLIDKEDLILIINLQLWLTYVKEGLIESIPEFHALLQEIHSLLQEGVSADKIPLQLSPWTSALFEFLPPFIRDKEYLHNLLLYLESDDSAQMSQIETEKLLAELVEAEMNKRQKDGSYKGKKLNAICHFFGYQARGSLPSKFDCDYAYLGLNGYMATVTNLKSPSNKWRYGASPITIDSNFLHLLLDYGSRRHEYVANM